MPFFERERARLYYEDSGGDGPAVTLSHGIFMDHDMFDPQVAALRGEFRCISWDERGHGSSWSEGPFTYWDMADDLVALLDHLGVDRAILAGMSQGGFLSLRASLRAPQRVAGLFLIDTQAGGEIEDAVPLYESMAAEWTTRGPQRHLAEAMAAVIVDPAPREEWIEKWLAASASYPVEPMRCLVERDDVTDGLAEIEAPALVVHGEADPAIPLERADALCRGLASCEGLVTIPGAGHAANLSHPQEVNERLLDFCRRHGTR